MTMGIACLGNKMIHGGSLAVNHSCDPNTLFSLFNGSMWYIKHTFKGVQVLVILHPGTSSLGGSAISNF